MFRSEREWARIGRDYISPTGPEMASVGVASSRPRLRILVSKLPANGGICFEWSPSRRPRGEGSPRERLAKGIRPNSSHFSQPGPDFGQVWPYLVKVGSNSAEADNCRNISERLSDVAAASAAPGVYSEHVLAKLQGWPPCLRSGGAKSVVHLHILGGALMMVVRGRQGARALALRLPRGKVALTVVADCVPQALCEP